MICKHPFFYSTTSAASFGRSKLIPLVAGENPTANKFTHFRPQWLVGRAGLERTTNPPSNARRKDDDEKPLRALKGEGKVLLPLPEFGLRLYFGEFGLG